ncbi:hypothetical protein TL16_g09285 [Triparma laevis f. inornata]|uniref:Uncharacterized protein n=1 Tax=Triparma laevis f. inornata TaxID=1714386 RepID=A0A9W7EIU2_9STRA|nr:hypothetical protein TL16_g09285 [Triparma laevis f. inornata]
MADFVPYSDHPVLGAEDIVPTIKQKNKKVSRNPLKGIKNVYKNPKSILTSVFKKRAAKSKAERMQEKAKKVESESEESSSEDELDSSCSSESSSDESETASPEKTYNGEVSDLSVTSQQVRYNLPLNIPQNTGVNYDSDGDVSVGSNYSNASSSSSASAQIREKVKSVLRDTSDFKTPREPQPPPQKPHQKTRGVTFEDVKKKNELKEKVEGFKPVEPVEVKKQKVYSREEIDEVFSKIRHNRYDSLKSLFSSRFPINSRDLHGNTPLILSAQNNNKRILKLCLRYHADINAVNNKGNTALHYTCYYEYTELSQTLRKYGAKVDIKNGEGNICFVMKAVR